MRLLSNPVGRTRKTSFPLSSNSKASLCSDFQTNPNSCEHIRSIRHFIDCKTVRKKQFLRIQVRASSQQKVWNEAENRERDWGETLKIFSLASHALRACEARALRARKTLTPRFTDFFTDFEKKTDCFAV